MCHIRVYMHVVLIVLYLTEAELNKHEEKAYYGLVHLTLADPTKVVSC